jgi:hypothetical protein
LVKNKEKGFLRDFKKISPKNIPSGSGSEIRNPEKNHPRPGSRIQGVKKAPDPDSQDWISIINPDSAGSVDP